MADQETDPSDHDYLEFDVSDEQTRPETSAALADPMERCRAFCRAASPVELRISWRSWRRIGDEARERVAEEIATEREIQLTNLS